MRLARIARYPVKSCRGIPVDRARVGARGIDDDRRWMIVDRDGAFVTQREEPRLALVDVALEEGLLRLAAPGTDDVLVPSRLAAGPRVTVRVWRSTVDAIPHEGASAFFSRFLGREVRAVYMPDDVRRAIDPVFSREGDVVSFADGYPLLAATRASLDDLSARLEVPLSMARFRPNVVVEGSAPWEEDRWAAITIGEVRFRAPKPCDRCSITTIDPATGRIGKEPLRTLATFRRRDGKVLFGVNLIPDLALDASAEIAVGDPVAVELA